MKVGSLLTQQEVTFRFKYSPFDKQLVFHNDRYHVRHRAVFSGVGGSKTKCGLAEVFDIMMHNDGAVCYCFEPTYKMVRRVLIPTLESKDLLGPSVETCAIVNSYHRGDGYIQFFNGAEFWFGSLEEPEYAEGANVDVIYIDEAQYIRKFAESQDVALRRLRGSGKTERDITQSIVTTTPPPLLPNCRLYDFYENPETKNPDTKVYRWSMLDNPHLSEQYKQEILATHHGSLAKRFVDGLFAPIGTGSFDFDSTIHEIREAPSDLREVVYGVDFGWTNPSAVVAAGFDGDDRVYILDEFYQNRTQTETLIQEIKQMQQEHGEGQVICDSSQPQTIDMLCKAGLMASGNTSKREDGIAELGSRFYVQGDGKPRPYVLSKCVKWISEVMVYDAEVKENDHAVDATRYAIMSRAGSGGLDVSFGKAKL